MTLPNRTNHGNISASISFSSRSIYYLLVDFVTVFFNGFISYLFYRFTSCQTVFNCYVVKLCVGYIAQSAVKHLFELFNDVYLHVAFPVGMCIFLRYSRFVESAHILNTHTLIALNRLWAIAAPFSYRNYNQSTSLMTIAKICAVSFLYIHVFVIPWMVVDAVVKNSRNITIEAPNCSPSGSAPFAMSYALQLVLFGGPILAILTCYFYILCKRIKIKAARKNLVVVAAPLIPLQPPNPLNANPVNRPAENPSRNKQNKDAHFLTLTLLIISLTCTLLPSQVYSSLVPFGIQSRSTYLVLWALYALTLLQDFSSRQGQAGICHAKAHGGICYPADQLRCFAEQLNGYV
ncbi:hypothetical protein RvY_03549 [Ramazzottius varieornatus]|uniref:G-protein coupled receptors family 1 profile domain-containing protein n=1 Tax=Ramazzottius varieornatus TaxID=947166 RepID=A0A1D1UNG3_RAMVA|nr:hypothetical protein RvY_03549 [Ramazzottius varieornatus]